MFSLEKLVDSLANNKPVRRKIGAAGRVHIDRQLPFLCLYRQPEGTDWGTRKLVQSESSYLVLPHDVPHTYACNLMKAIVETQSAHFGTFLVVDLRAREQSVSGDDVSGDIGAPSFVITSDAWDDLDQTVSVLKAQCEKIVINRTRAHVVTRQERDLASERLAPCMNAREARRLGCRVIGIDITPLYRDDKNHYPLVLRALRRGLSRALQRAFFNFGKVQTSGTPPHYLALGKRAFVKAVFKVDEALADIDSSFDFLLQTTPVNAEQAWQAFKKARYDEEPRFVYRQLPFDPSVVKRRLFRVPTERIEDPTLEHILCEKQHELDSKLSLMRLIGTRRFLYGSMQIFGTVDPSLRRTAEEILASLPRKRHAGKKMVGVRTFERMAAKEIAYYQKMQPAFNPPVEVRNDMYAGLLVSHGSLLIGKGFAVSRKRAKALLNHEVGTHLLTYYNGKSQPFQQLRIGLAGYDELQEGLGVLSEYLGGGFSRERLRILAARVIAVDDVINGAGMIDIFRALHDQYGFADKLAFQIALRVCRGGGLTKDAIYLRGLLKILDYIRDGGDLGILFVGKIAVEHIPLIKELQWRKVIVPIPLVPRVLTEKRSHERLAQLRLSQGLEPLIVQERGSA